MSWNQKKASVAGGFEFRREATRTLLQILLLLLKPPPSCAPPRKLSQPLVMLISQYADHHQHVSDSDHFK